jgi:hypothetical protein
MSRHGKRRKTDVGSLVGSSHAALLQYSFRDPKDQKDFFCRFFDLYELTESAMRVISSRPVLSITFTHSEKDSSSNCGSNNIIVNSELNTWSSIAVCWWFQYVSKSMGKGYRVITR